MSKLEQLAEAVQIATSNLGNAEAAESYARNNTTEARNTLSAAQKAFDAAVEEMKKSAPLGSEWGRVTREKDRLRA